MPDPPTGTVTLLFTDIEGSTRLLGQDQGRYIAALAEHHRLLRAAFRAQDGHEIGTEGDAFFVAFRRVRDAIVAAIAGQRALNEATWPDGLEIRVRMGLHTGEPALVGTNYVGIDVNRAARICGAAHGGQILVSDTARQLVATGLPGGVTLRGRRFGRAHSQALLTITGLAQPPFRFIAGADAVAQAEEKLAERHRQIDACRETVYVARARRGHRLSIHQNTGGAHHRGLLGHRRGDRIRVLADERGDGRIALEATSRTAIDRRDVRARPAGARPRGHPRQRRPRHADRAVPLRPARGRTAACPAR